MTSAELTKWMTEMGIKTRKHAALTLGIDRERMGRFLDGEVEIPVYIGFACSALAAGLPPYTGGKVKLTDGQKSLRKAVQDVVRSAGTLDQLIQKSPVAGS